MIDRLKLAFEVLIGKTGMLHGYRVPGDSLLVNKKEYESLVEIHDLYKFALGMIYKDKDTSEQWEKLRRAIEKK